MGEIGQVDRATMRRPRIESIQVMRGVAAIAVLVTHSLDMAWNSDPAFSSEQLGHLPQFGAIGVDLFFVISGFVMAFSVYGKDGLTAGRRFLVQRWIRVGPPYLIVTAVAIALSLAAGQLPAWRSLANSILFVPWFDVEKFTFPPLIVGWTLSLEFTFYLFVLAVVLMSATRHIGYLALAIAALVAIGFVVPNGVFLLDWITNPIFLEFAFGILAYIVWTKGWLDRFRPVFTIGAIAGLAALVVQLVVGYGSIFQAEVVLDGRVSMQRVIWWGLPMLLIFLAVLPVQPRKTRAHTRLWLLLGNASFSIYLVHVPVIRLVQYAAKYSPLVVPGWTVLAIALVSGVVAGLLFFRFVERPLTKWLSSSGSHLNSSKPEMVR